MDTCTSSYTPQPLASFFHQIPHVNTSLLETPSVVAGTLSYFEAVIIWGCLPALVAVVVFTVLMVYNCLVCYCCCPTEMYNAKKKALGCGVVTGIGIVVCILLLAGGLFVEVELGRSVDKFVRFVESTAAYREQTISFSSSLSGQGLEVGIFNESLNTVIGSARDNIAAAELQSTANQLAGNLTDLRSVATPFEFTPTSERLLVAEAASNCDLTPFHRHWTVLALLVVLTLVMVVVLISVACAKVRFLLCMMVTLTLVMIVTWLGVVLGMVGTMVVADFCADPDGTLRATQDPSLAAQVDYYLVCAPDCNSSKLSLFSALEELFVEVDARLSSVEVGGFTTTDAMASFGMVRETLESSNSTFQALKVEVFSCETINTMYVSARDVPYTGPMGDASYSLCNSGMVFMVTLFAIFTVLVFSMVVVLCCATAFFGFIRAMEEEGLYDFSTKTDSFLPKNFAGDYASSTWTRPQPAMLGGGMQSSGGAFTTTVEVAQRPSEGYEMHQFNTMDSQGMEERSRSEPPQYNDIVMNEQELAPGADSTAVAPNSFGMDLAEGHVV